MAQDIEARIRALEAQVRLLNDREAIRALRYRYHECINERRLSEISDLFTENGALDFGDLGNAHGRAEVSRFFEVEVARRASFLKQFVHNHVVEVRGDSGTGFSYLEAKTITGDEPYLVAGRYDDEYARENGRWKFERMRLTAYFAVPLSEGWARAARLETDR